MFSHLLHNPVTLLFQCMLFCFQLGNFCRCPFPCSTQFPNALLLLTNPLFLFCVNPLQLFNGLAVLGHLFPTGRQLGLQFLFLLLFNIPNVLVRYFGCHWGYNSGMKALNRFEELGLTEKIFTAAAIIGLLVIGGMSASMVSINPVVAIGSGDNAIKLIDVINGIMPKMLSLFTTLGVYRLLKKGTKPNTILLGIIVVSVLLTAIGIF